MFRQRKGRNFMRGPERRFPGGSRERVTKAGDAIRNGIDTMDDRVVVELWRYAHRHVINTFQAVLRTRTRGTNIVVAQRHKRRTTIFDKLNRFPKMQLGRMDDVAGCRLIFDNIDELSMFRAALHTARFQHKLRNSPDKYDYIEAPKSSGYRGVHDVYEYDVKSEAGKDYKGLYIELQYRTRPQHAWATAVELVGHLTENQPKFDRGDENHKIQMQLASEIIARAWEGRRSCCPDLTDEELVKQFVDLDHETHIMPMLRELNAAHSDDDDRRNMILAFKANGDLDMHSYRDATEAMKALFEMEKANTDGDDIVLVKGDSEDVREAFKNYFSDARDFIHLIDDGCRRLMWDRIVEFGEL
jgi:ppGpp synthetase/RelA/SpoT-type nucleotidyltranferase